MTDDFRITTYVDSESLPHERLQQALRYWNMRRGERAMPTRADIDPVDIPYLLSHLMIVDRGSDGRCAVIRLAGTRIVDEFSFDPTGRNLHDVPEMASLSALCRSTATGAAPLYVEGALAWSTVGHKPFCALCLPLSENGSSVDKMLIAFHFPELPSSDDLFGDWSARQTL